MSTSTRTHIADAIEALAGIRRVSVTEVLEAVGMKKSTYYRRRREDSWEAKEALQLAAYFRVPVAKLYEDPELWLNGEADQGSRKSSVSTPPIGVSEQMAA